MSVTQSVGFVPFGHEPAALKVGDRYIDNVHLTLDLSSTDNWR
jgi:hypothetical protein